MAKEQTEGHSKVFGATFQEADRRKMVHAMTHTERRATDILLEAFREWFDRRFPAWKP